AGPAGAVVESGKAATLRLAVGRRAEHAAARDRLAGGVVDEHYPQRSGGQVEGQGQRRVGSHFEQLRGDGARIVARAWVAEEEAHQVLAGDVQALEDEASVRVGLHERA